MPRTLLSFALLALLSGCPTPPPENQPPSATDDTATTNQDTAVIIQAATLLANDTDPDGDTLSIVSVQGALSGAVTLANNSITFTPDAGFIGEARFEYTITDEDGAADSALVLVSVNAVNNAPIADDQSISTDEDIAAPITLTGSDPDGTPLSFAVVTNPINGSLSGSAPDLIYTPNADFHGVDSFTFQTNDGALDSNIATVSINISAINDAPIGVDDSSVVEPGESASILKVVLLANDIDVDADPLLFVQAENPINGVVSETGASVIFTPNPGVLESSFEYVLSDGQATARATVNIFTATCGDGILSAPEECDDGNFSNNDACTNLCLNNICGDFFVFNQNGGTEQCDDGNLSNNDACLNTCLTATCGDGFLRTAGVAIIEECDDSNTTPGDGCDAICKLEFDSCGDGIAQPNEICFLPKGTFRTGLDSFAVVTGDFNEDNLQALVVANRLDDNISLLLGDGSGEFDTQTTFATGIDPGAMSSADFNGDGFLDLVVMNQTSDDVSILLGDGAGSFTPQLLPVQANPIAIAVSDFNGDGFQDLAVSHGSPSEVSVLLGNGAGGFSAPTVFDVGSSAIALLAADVNDDGDQDLLALARSAADVDVFLGDGAGSFVRSTLQIATLSRTMTVGDFNEDGVLDLAIASASPNRLRIHLGNGAGGFGAASAAVPIDDPVSMKTADFNGDGFLDLAIQQIIESSPDASHVGILLGDGTGDFSSQTRFFNGANPIDLLTLRDSPDSIALADLNGDGVIDISTSNRSGSVSVLLGDGLGAFSPQVAYSATEGINDFVIADADEDGFLDIVTTTAEILPGDGDGVFGSAVPFPESGAKTALAVADFNEDNLLDIAITVNSAPQSVNVVLNDGAGGFGPLVSFPVGLNAQALLAQDFNEDGHLDLVSANFSSDNLSLLLGDGAGSFGAASTITVGNGPMALRAADLNEDGHLDLIVGNNAAGDTITVLLGDGAGGFISSSISVPGALELADQGSIALGDLDEDGNLDLVLASDSFVRVLSGDGAGGFGPSRTLVTSSGSVTLADVNQDGHLDLLSNLPEELLSNFSAGLRVLLGDGTGGFRAQLSLHLGGRTIITADVNGDGILDLTAQGRVASTINVLLGDR